MLGPATDEAEDEEEKDYSYQNRHRDVISFSYVAYLDSGLSATLFGSFPIMTHRTIVMMKQIQKGRPWIRQQVTREMPNMYDRAAWMPRT